MLYIKTAWGWTRAWGWEPYTEKAPADPELYKGPLPSFEARAFIRGMEREHAEWVKRRAMMKDQHDGKDSTESPSAPASKA